MSLPEFSLIGRVALVTGGSKGLGLAMARGLARAGADVAICSRTAADLPQALASILEGTERRGAWFEADLSQRGVADRLAQQVAEQLGGIDILVNNAGTNSPQPIDAITDATWDRLLELNLSSVMAMSRAVVPGMKARGWGRILHISSIMGHVSKKGRSAYSATKSALAGLARAMALELGGQGITVNCLAPGPFLTELPLTVLTEAERQVFSDRTALGRWGQPAELVGPTLLLASEAGRYITGTTLVVDGGYLAG